MPELVNSTAVMGVGLSGLATLALASLFFKNTVGFVYTSQTNPEMVKISYMDIWGARKDVEMNIQEVYTLNELSRHALESYFSSLRFTNGQPPMKLFYKAGGVLNLDEFTKVFGSE